LDSPKKIFFLSDLHLGTPTPAESFSREKKVIDFLDSIFHKTESLFLVGDIFDFWFDYKTVVPKGYVRIMAKLAQFSDAGIPVHYFKGNHDMWLDGYFENELGFTVHDDNYVFSAHGKTFLVGHGDGKGPDDVGYKRLKKIFRNPLCRWAFRWLHPDIGMAVAHAWSKRSRYATGEKLEKFSGVENEWLVHYVRRKQQHNPADFYIFGHRHLPLEIAIDENTKYINLGDWLHYQSYAEFDGHHLHLKYFEKQAPVL
jgi:UDP-2,3-diacylglucosamine hydrolase